MLLISHLTISSSIPNTIGNLSKLSYLVLNNNNFSGIIPYEITQLVDLKHLSLAFNNFIGSFSQDIFQLRHLEILLDAKELKRGFGNSLFIHCKSVGNK